MTKINKKICKKFCLKPKVAKLLTWQVVFNVSEYGEGQISNYVQYIYDFLSTE